jgi:hypothetical protein
MSNKSKNRHLLAQGTLAALALGVFSQANATLVLDTSVTSGFIPYATTTSTGGNDLPLPRPSTLYFGQLGANANGYADFYYVGNEAAYTNWLVTPAWSHSTAGRPDNFNAPHPFIGSISVTAGSLLSFGFCTSGGAYVPGAGTCAFNDNASSLIAQYNYGGVGGYRSIGFAPLTSYDPATGARQFANGSDPSDWWMVFWDDSGAKNDDNHDDYIGAIHLRRISVAEPSALLLFGTGLLLLGAMLRGRRRATVR